MAGQLGLFDTRQDDDHAQAACGRARMIGMIERLRGVSVPPWKDETAVILDDGSFRRAMRLVPEAEAAGLWAVYDAEMERLYAAFAGGRA